MKQRIFYILLLFSLVACKNSLLDYKTNYIYQSDNTLNYDIKIDYPVFKSSDLKELNQAIKSTIDSNIFEFKKFILDFEGVSMRSLSYGFEVKLNNEEYISITQTFSWAVPGVERILYRYKNINYNRVKKKFISVDELFLPNSNFRDSLKAIANENLKLNSFPTVDSIESFDNFFFSKDTLYFNLLLTDQTQYSDYTFAVEKSRLKKLMK